MVNLRLTCFIAALAAGIVGSAALDAGLAAKSPTKLTGAQIRARFIGMQLTDEIHYRFVYERDGTLRSVAAGAKKQGNWTVEDGRLCLYLQAADDGCYDVTLAGDTFTLTPVGLGLPVNGILQTISDPRR